MRDRRRRSCRSRAPGLLDASLAVSCHLVKDDFREVDSGAHVRVDHRPGVLKRCIDEGASPAGTGVENGYGEGRLSLVMASDVFWIPISVRRSAWIGRTERSCFFRLSAAKNLVIVRDDDQVVAVCSEQLGELKTYTARCACHERQRRDGRHGGSLRELFGDIVAGQWRAIVPRVRRWSGRVGSIGRLRCTTRRHHAFPSE